MTTEEQHTSPLPTIEGRVHGIVGWDPIAVQCDNCLKVWRGGTPIITVQKAIFNGRDPGPRLCDACWEKRGWVNTPSRGWQQI